MLYIGADNRSTPTVEVKLSAALLMHEVQKGSFNDHREIKGQGSPAAPGQGTTALQETASLRLVSFLLCNVSHLHQTIAKCLIPTVLQGHALLWLNTCFFKRLLYRSWEMLAEWIWNEEKNHGNAWRSFMSYSIARSRTVYMLFLSPWKYKPSLTMQMLTKENPIHQQAHFFQRCDLNLR